MCKSNKKWKEDYYKSLTTKKWKEKREKIIKRDNNKCVICGETKKLHVHHKKYENHISKAYEYDDNTLITLCESCHKSEHNLEKPTFKNIYDSLVPDFLRGEDFYLSDGVWIRSDGTTYFD